MRHYLSQLFNSIRTLTPRAKTSLVQTAPRTRLAVETLEDRRLMATGVFSGSIFSFDNDLTAVVRPSPYNASVNEVFVDGSDFDDHVTVVEFTVGLFSTMTLQLDKWSSGTLLSSRTLQLTALNLGTSLYALNAELRGGNDRLINNTFAPMLASGGTGADLIYGGSNNDYIRGDSGQNGLLGREGNDVISGGDEADGIYGGPGNDFLDGLGGNDWIFGDSGDNNSPIGGNDTIRGGLGNDNLFGGAGQDEIRGDRGNDILWGGMQNDSMWGGDGDDVMYGDAGSDRLLGESGYDRLYGGADDDYLDAGYKVTPNLNYAEYLHGGTGKDTFVRHKSFFGSNDPDLFADYNSATGDKIKSDWHW